MSRAILSRNSDYMPPTLMTLLIAECCGVVCAHQHVLCVFWEVQSKCSQPIPDRKRFLCVDAELSLSQGELSLSSLVVVLRPPAFFGCICEQLDIRERSLQRRTRVRQSLDPPRKLFACQT